jgi:hypothetical protein
LKIGLHLDFSPSFFVLSSPAGIFAKAGSVRLVGHVSLFRQSRFERALIWQAARGVMEILGLVPCQSETQYPNRFFKSAGSGKKAETCFHFISACRDLPGRRGNIVEIRFHSENGYPQ